MIECTYLDKKRMHNLKYYTWIEQQGKTLSELNAQWWALASQNLSLNSLYVFHPFPQLFHFIIFCLFIQTPLSDPPPRYDEAYWTSKWNRVARYEQLIKEFNAKVGIKV